MSTNSNLSRANWEQLWRYLSLCFLSLGIIVRIVQYISNRSLWGDEVNLALNIIERSYGELTQVLDNNQAAPLGFLWLEKLATQIWGHSEYALRLLPFLASIISLGIFYRLVSQHSSALGAMIAIALFACGRYTLYFATELKPYSSDVAIALILIWLLVKSYQKSLQTQDLIKLALVGSLAIWLSYPSVFILAGLEGWNLLASRQKYWRQIIVNRLVMYLAWLTSFGLFYWLAIVNTLSNEDLNSSWSSRYPDSWGDILWLFDALGRFFYHPLGFLGVTDGIGIFSFIVGCVVWYRRQRSLFLALIAPFIATLIAAYLHKYPFRDRLILFLAPLGIMIVAEGIAMMLAQITKLNFAKSAIWSSMFSLLGVICFSTLVIPAVYRASNFVVYPEKKHELKPVLEYVVQQSQPTDKIYVYAEGNRAFLYYSKLKGYDKLNYTYGTTSFSYKGKKLSDKQRELAEDLQPLLGQRVWFILRADPQPEQEIIEYLDHNGKKQDYFPQTGASAYLYELNSL